MKSKEEVLSMSKEELMDYKYSNYLKKIDINCDFCSNYLRCSDCSDCSYCSDLVNGLFCRNLHLETQDRNKYYICNVEVTKEEFEKKKKEIKQNE